MLIGNGGSKMADASSSFFWYKWRHHDITALLNVIYILANFLTFFNTLLFKHFSGCMCTSREIWILPINSTRIKLSPNVGNDEYIVLCNFGGGIARAVFRRYRGGSSGAPPLPLLPQVAGSEKKHGLNRVKCKYQEWKYILKNSLP